MKKLLLFAFCCLFFQVSSQNVEEIRRETPFRWTGSLNLHTDFYAISGNNPYRSDRFAWRVSGNPTAYVYGLAVPFSFTVGRQNRDVRYPVYQQFGASPYWKWLKIHGGYRNLNFSPYTLAGHTFLGGGVELTPGKLRFAAMAGRFQRARLGNDGQQFFLPSYRRVGYGVKLGLGTERNFVDLLFFKAKDDPNSLPLADSAGITPAENAVIGLTSRFTMWRKLTLTMDGAASAYTRNIGSTVLNLDSLEGGQFRRAAFFYQPRFSTRLNFAGKTTLAWQGKIGSLALGWEHIDPEYATMGAYFFQNDLENWTVAPAISFAKNRARFSGSLGFQRNNLLGNRSETSWRRIGAANLSVNPSQKFGVDFNFSNYRMTQTATAFELSDSMKLAQLTTQISVTPRFLFMRKETMHSLVFNVNYQFLDDQNPLTEQFGDVQATTAVLSWAVSFLEKKTSVNAGLNAYKIRLASIETTNFGLSAGGSQPFLDDKLNLSINGMLALQQVDGTADGTISSLGMNGNWRFHKKHGLNFGLNWLRSSTTSRGHFSEWRGQVGYSWQLR